MNMEKLIIKPPSRTTINKQRTTPHVIPNSLGESIMKWFDPLFFGQIFQDSLERSLVILVEQR